MGENPGSKVTYLLVGLGLGVLVGILFAPKSGEETREFLAEKADEGSKYAQRKARELKERAEDLVEKSKEVATRQKRSEEHTSELQSLAYLVCRLLLEKKKKI